MEWADSLEGEGMINIEHKLLNTFLTLREMTKEEVQVKVKELNGKKDAIVRKAQGTLCSLSKEKEKFKEIVNEFYKLKKLVYKNESLRNELGDFEKYKQMKDALDKEIKKANDNLTLLKIYRENFNSRAQKERENIMLLIKTTREEKKKIIKNEKLKRDLIKYLDYVSKKMKTVDLVLSMDKNRDELTNELNELLRKTKALEISSQNGNSSKDINEIEKKFKNINNKKTLLEENNKEIAETPLINFFKG